VSSTKSQDDLNREAYYRIQSARQHLNRKFIEAAGNLDLILRDLAAHARSVAFLEAVPARRAELSAVADGLENLVDAFNALTARVWAVMQPGWTVDGEQEGDER
jgi:hypothetical protein